MQLKGILTKSNTALRSQLAVPSQPGKLKFSNLTAYRLKPSVMVEDVCGDKVKSIVGYVTDIIEKEGRYANHNVSQIVPAYLSSPWIDGNIPNSGYASALPYKTIPEYKKHIKIKPHHIAIMVAGSVVAIPAVLIALKMQANKKVSEFTKWEDFYTVHYRAAMVDEFDFRGLPDEFIKKIKPLYQNKNTNPGAPLLLEYMARQSAFASNLATQAHLYWNALLLTKDLNASDPVKIEIRKKCIEGLAHTANQRGQSFYSSLLNLDASLSDVYLRSEKARNDQKAFLANMKELHDLLAPLDTVTQTQYKIDEAERILSKKQHGAGAIATSVLVSTAIGETGGKSYDKMQEARFNKLKQEMSLYQEKLNVVMYKKLSNTVREGKIFKKFESDVTDIESGKAFIAYDIWYFLLNNEQSTLEILQEFARNKPQLNKLLIAYKQDKDKETAAQNIVKKLLEYELVCSLYERKGKAIPQNYLDSKF